MFNNYLKKASVRSQRPYSLSICGEKKLSLQKSIAVRWKISCDRALLVITLEQYLEQCKPKIAIDKS